MNVLQITKIFHTKISPFISLKKKEHKPHGSAFRRYDTLPESMYHLVENMESYGNHEI